MITAIPKLLTNFKLIAGSVVAIAALGVVFYVKMIGDQNERLKTENNRLNSEYQSLVLTLENQKQLLVESERLRSVYVEKVDEIQKQTSDFRACVAAGKCGVRIKTNCPTLPEPAPGTHGTDSRTSELDTAAGFNLLDLREGIVKLEAKYRWCQSELKIRSAGE